jgi:hypothetical protein
MYLPLETDKLKQELYGCLWGINKRQGANSIIIIMIVFAARGRRNRLCAGHVVNGCFLDWMVYDE